MTKKKQAERQEAIEQLRAILPPGSTVYCLVTHVARSGMSRRMRFFLMDGGMPSRLTHLIAMALDYPLVNGSGGNWEMRVGGCGMDMGFHVVNSLSYALHGRETTGPDAEKAAAKGYAFRPTRTQFRAGYSLTHEWL